MARKALTLKQAETQINANAEKYRQYVAAQVEKKNAKNKKEQDAAQAKMDKLRGGYTAYRTAYRDFLAAGGTRRSSKPKAKAAPKKSGGKKSSSKKNSGSGKRNPVKAGQLSKKQQAAVNDGSSSFEQKPQLNEGVSLSEVENA